MLEQKDSLRTGDLIIAILAYSVLKGRDYVPGRTVGAFHTRLKAALTILNNSDKDDVRSAVSDFYRDIVSGRYEALDAALYEMRSFQMLEMYDGSAPTARMTMTPKVARQILATHGAMVPELEQAYQALYN